ncbi:hypothetical protein, partial [Streptomyces albidus (ex Kaewkla and Franco 2022)]|uniref:hypothetical protein n=1 Tax=Streptomyces albidus (ex Kaewkla and Franco 2022) TaxID=722709 RepID=UPI001B357818
MLEPNNESAAEENAEKAEKLQQPADPAQQSDAAAAEAPPAPASGFASPSDTLPPRRRRAATRPAGPPEPVAAPAVDDVNVSPAQAEAIGAASAAPGDSPADAP